MENNTANLQVDLDLEEAEDTLSLCDLPITGNQEPDPDAFPDPVSPSAKEFFGFLADSSSEETDSPITKNNIVFCGRTLSYREPTRFETYQNQRANPFLWRSESFSKTRSFRSDGRKSGLMNTANSSPSPLSLTPKPSSRKHKAVIGLAKIPTKMELSDIRKRQSRKSPAPMFAVVAGNGSGGRSRHSHWGLLRPLRCRSHLVSMLARASFGCISLV